LLSIFACKVLSFGISLPKMLWIRVFRPRLVSEFFSLTPGPPVRRPPGFTLLTPAFYDPRCCRTSALHPLSPYIVFNLPPPDFSFLTFVRRVFLTVRLDATHLVTAQRACYLASLSARSARNFSLAGFFRDTALEFPPNPSPLPARKSPKDLFPVIFIEPAVGLRSTGEGQYIVTTHTFPKPVFHLCQDLQGRSLNIFRT